MKENVSGCFFLNTVYKILHNIRLFSCVLYESLFSTQCYKHKKYIYKKKFIAGSLDNS